jgi:hypothetical protein
LSLLLLMCYITFIDLCIQYYILMSQEYVLELLK